MARSNAYFSFNDRRDEKQLSRENDIRALKEGYISSADLARRNDFFAELDIERFALVAIGRRAFASR